MFKRKKKTVSKAREKKKMMFNLLESLSIEN
jgi:hypothetical protein